MSTTDTTPERVVVGVDGSDESLAAADIAAEEARLRGCSLEVVHAFIWPELRVPLGPPPGAPPEAGLRNHAERIVAEGVSRARTAAPGTDVTGSLVTGAAPPVLLRCARAADLVVIGDRGLGGFTGLVVGSAAVALAAHATCPVLVVRGHHEGTGAVVVGVDGSPTSRVAVDHAFKSAALHGSPLIALHARRHRAPARRDVAGADREGDPFTDESTRSARAILDEGRHRHPGVDVELTVADDDPRTALIKASRSARLVVVGSRGRGGFTGLLLGSVSHAVLHHAACPVVVVPHSLLERREQPVADTA